MVIFFKITYNTGYSDLVLENADEKILTQDRVLPGFNVLTIDDNDSDPIQDENENNILGVK